MKLILIPFTIALILFTGCARNPKINRSLKGTSWTSEFYYYCNFYKFETDSTGYSEDGQVAWSCPIDTSILGTSKNDILYADPEKFNYSVKGSILTIEYLNWKPHGNIHRRVFYYRKKYDDWISEYEYTYGNECLEKGTRKKRFE